MSRDLFGETPAGQRPPWIDGLELSPIYDKKWGERLVDVPSTSPN